MAVHAPDRLVGVRDALAQIAQKVTVKFGHRVADGVRDIDRRGAFAYRSLEDATRKSAERQPSWRELSLR
jgi:hypothetical protein